MERRLYNASQIPLIQFFCQSEIGYSVIQLNTFFVFISLFISFLIHFPLSLFCCWLVDHSLPHLFIYSAYTYSPTLLLISFILFYFIPFNKSTLI